MSVALNSASTYSSFPSRDHRGEAKPARQNLIGAGYLASPSSAYTAATSASASAGETFIR